MINFTYPTILIGSEVVIAAHQSKGLIVVASKDFAKDAHLASAICYEISAGEVAMLSGADVYKFVFFQRGDEGSANRRGYFAFGSASFCSHSDTPNAYIRWKDVDYTRIIELRAAEPITAGTEVTIRYSNINEYPGHENWI